MPDRPMKFCASMSKCGSAYTVGEPGTVKIAHDSAPVDEGKINQILSFLSGRLSDEDYSSVADMLDDVVDLAEDRNPTKAMAKDGFPASTRRAIRRSVRNAVMGYDARPVGIGMALDGQHAADVKALLPNHDRMKGGSAVGYAAPMPPKPSKLVPAATRAEIEREFPHMFKGN